MLRTTLMLLLSTFWLSHANAQGGETVTLATKGGYPPWNFVNESGEIDGFEREFGDELCRRADLTCAWVLNEWATIIPNLIDGQYDAIISGMAITPERAERIAFSQAYTPPDLSRYVALSEDIDLDDATIAVQAGTIQEGYLNDIGADVMALRNHDDTLKAVETGAAGALLANGTFLAEVVRMNEKMVLVGEPVALSGGSGIGLRQSDVALREAFDAAIASMKDDGSLNVLIEKWGVSGQW